MVDSEGDIGFNKSIDPIKGKEASLEKARKIIQMGEAALAGEYDADFSLSGRKKSQGREMSGQPDEENFILWHENPEIQEKIVRWIAEKVGVATVEELEEAPKLPLAYDHDDTMKMEVFAREYGFVEHPWYIVRFLQKNEQGRFENPLYAVRSGQVIQEQIDAFQVFHETQSSEDGSE